MIKPEKFPEYSTKKISQRAKGDLPATQLKGRVVYKNNFSVGGILTIPPLAMSEANTNPLIAMLEERH